MSSFPAASRPATLRFALPCDLHQVRGAAKTVHGFLAEQGCGEDLLTACELALVEACNNAIKYAPEPARTRPVDVEIACSDGLLEMRVTDHTVGFDWPEQVELPSPESESGRGLFLIQTLMDSAQYLRGNGENVLVLRKSRGPVVKHNGKPRALIDNERLISGLIDELSAAQESLAAIFRYSTEKIHDPKKFAHRLLADLSALIGAEWFAFRTVENQSRLDVLTASESALDLAPAISLSAKSDADFLESQAADRRHPVSFDENTELAPTEPLRLKPHARGLVFPIFVEQNFVGTLAIGKNGRTRPEINRRDASAAAESAATPSAPGQFLFTRTHLNLITNFARFLAIQIANTRFQEELVSNRLIARELELAGNIQRSLMLKELPQLPDFELAALCRSAQQVGGDFYDVLKLGDDMALLVIADVMGKGVLAAMFAAILRAVLRATPELNCQPAALLMRVNQLLFDELSGVDMFITAQLAFVDTKARRLVVGSAGHCPLLIADGSEVKALSPEGMPLGILPDPVYATERVDLPPNCRVMLYTDGLTEAVNASGERFGQDRLIAWFQEARGRSAGELQEDLAAELAQFQIKTGLNDDQTFLIMTESRGHNEKASPGG